MQLGAKRVVVRFFIFALIGLLIEVFFTSIGKIVSGNLGVHGHTSPLMMVDYGLLGVVLMPMARPMIRRGIPLVFRAVVYMIGIFFIEFVSGWIFDLCGIHIWDYSNHAFNLYGYITLTYAPFWYTLGLFVEWLHKKIDAVAVLLLAGITAEQLESHFGKSRV
jgi:uncharacterized membrane protein